MNGSSIPMEDNDAGASSVEEYLWLLGKTAWDLKRPFGNSDWDYELAEALYKAGKLKKAGPKTVEYSTGSYETFYFDDIELWNVVRGIYDDMWKKMNDGN